MDFLSRSLKHIALVFISFLSILGLQAQATLVGHWTFEPGSELIDLTGNFPDLVVHGGAWAGTAGLNIPGAGSWANTVGYSGPTITEKTLVSWAWINDLELRGGSILTIDKSDTDEFDGVVYAEREVHRWMAGSSSFRRTQDPTPGFAESVGGVLVQMAITYENVGGQTKVTIYRDGTQIGQYTKGTIASWSGSNVEVLFGARHSSGSTIPIGGMNGRIEEAMIFDGVLTQTEIQALTPDVPCTGPVPYPISQDDLDGEPIELGSELTINGTFSPGNCGPHTVSINWGDGTSSNATVDEVNLTYTASHTYASVGTYLLFWRIEEEGGQWSYGPGTQPVVVVSCLATPEITSDDLSGDPILLDAINGNLVAITGGFTAGCGTHTVSIDWGDGNTSAGTVDESGLTYAGSHTYTSPGVFMVEVSITDEEGATSAYMAAQTVLIYTDFCVSARINGTYDDPTDGLKTVVTAFAKYGNNGSLISSSEFLFFRRNQSSEVINCFASTSLSALAVAGNQATITGEGRFADLGPGPATHNFVITFEDVSELEGDLLDPIQSLSITEIGTGTVAYDLAAATNVQSQRVTVRDTEDPMIKTDDLTGDPVQLDFANGSVVNLSGTFGIGCGETHTVSIDWGDGTISNATVDEGTRSYSGSHTYMNTGVYLVEMTILDENGGTSTYLGSQPVMVYSATCGSARLNGTYFDPVDGKKTVVSTFAKYGSSTAFTAGSEFVFFRKDGSTTIDRLESTSITTLVISGNSATITGEASSNGNGPATHTFSISFQDVTNVKGDILDPIQTLVVTEIATGSAIYDLSTPTNVQSHRVKVFNTAGCRLGEIVDETALEMAVYPNPFSQSFVVEFSDQPESTYELRVFSTMGQEVYRTVSDQIKTKLPLNQVAAGIYFLQVRQGEIVTTTKLVKE